MSVVELPLPPPNHSRFVVLKHGHAGSLWLHSLLNAQPGVLSFFEFDGCGGGAAGRKEGVDGDDKVKKMDWLEASVSHVLAHGCCNPPSCSTVGQARFAPAGADTAASFAYACMRRELCSGRCPPRPPPGCAAVGLQRKLNSNVLQLLQPLFRPSRVASGVRLVLLVRDNSVKHAFSELRTKCRSWLKTPSALRHCIHELVWWLPGLRRLLCSPGHRLNRMEVCHGASTRLSLHPR
jgi:hypothetical protein